MESDPNLKLEFVPDVKMRNVSFDWFGIDEEEEVYLRFNPNMPGHKPHERRDIPRQPKITLGQAENVIFPNQRKLDLLKHEVEPGKQYIMKHERETLP